MICKCAWCGRITGTKPPYNDPSVTHGMCKDCFDKSCSGLESDGSARDKERVAGANEYYGRDVR